MQAKTDARKWGRARDIFWAMVTLGLLFSILAAMPPVPIVSTTTTQQP